jgi:dolichol-phosphate mannosyltransferase
VTVIVPCYNEEAGLPFLLERLRKMREHGADDWRFLFIDDGSSDATFSALLRAAQDENWIQVVRHPENLGLGAALRTGFEHAAIAGGLQHRQRLHVSAGKAARARRARPRRRRDRDRVRVAPESAAAEGSTIRIWLSRMVSSIYKLLIGQDVYTFTCLFRAYETESIRRIRFRSSGFAAVAEIMLRAMLSGFRVREVPMRLESRRFGESKLKVGDAIMAHCRLLLMTALMVGARQARSVGSKIVG